MENKLIVGVSGASGTIYALNLLNKLAKLNIQIDLVLYIVAVQLINIYGTFTVQAFTVIDGFAS